MTPIEWFGLIGIIALGMGFIAHLYRSTVDKLRLDALQTYHWQVACIDREFAVLAGSPPKVVGVPQDNVRKAIDAAILERQASRG